MGLGAKGSPRKLCDNLCYSKFHEQQAVDDNKIVTVIFFAHHLHIIAAELRRKEGQNARKIFDKNVSNPQS